MVLRGLGDNQTIFASVKPFYIKRLTGLNLVLITKVGWYDDLTFR